MSYVKLNDVLARFEELDIDYEVLNLGQETQLIVSQYGGRVLGPFDKNGTSLNWINPVFSNPIEFSKFISSNTWNLGGGRIWIAPEHDFFVQDRQNFYDSYVVQGNLDPGNYKVEKKNDVISVHQSTILSVLKSNQDINLLIESKISKVKSFETLRSLRNVEVFGYEQEITLKDETLHPFMDVEMWELLQLNPRGIILVPYIGEFKFVDYYEEVGGALKVHDSYVELYADGLNRFKTGFYANNTAGRSVYLNKTEEYYYMVFKQYDNDVLNNYLCDPWDKPGKKECSLFVYNDDGNGGEYVEFESSGHNVSARNGRESATNTVTHLYVTGEKGDIESAISRLINIDYKINF